MEKKALHQCPVAIVAAGSVLPDASGLEEFWVRLMEGVTSIRPLPEDRWSSAFHSTQDRSDREKTYTRYAASIDEKEYERLRKKFDQPEDGVCRMRLQILEAASQVFARFPKGFNSRKVDLYVGTMYYDDGATYANFEIESPAIRALLRSLPDPKAELWLRQFEEYREKALVPFLRKESYNLTYLINELQQLHGYSGAGAFVDAACASSMAAIDAGLRRLVSGEADYVLAGGAEGFLAPPAFISFTALGALATETCLPLDKRSEGASLGEGCVLFMFQRLEDAIRDGHEILAVVDGLGASSDGNAASLFSPTVNGQRRAYAECYQGLDIKRLAYLECHGTGTPLGDAVEIQSCAEHFGKNDLIVGSAKALWGHTRGAAGAVGLLKALMILQKNVIPPSRYYRKKISNLPSNFKINTESVPLDDSTAPLIGVSSFGFGGINYHMALSKWPGPTNFESRLLPVIKHAFVVDHEEVETAELRELKDWSELKISPRSREQTDLTQAAALMATKRAIERANIPLKLVDKNKIAVISACKIGLNNLKRFATSCHYREMSTVFSDMPENRVNQVVNLRKRYAPITEDTGAGGLNNVIAGRICNYFDFHGKNYHVDADDLSWTEALTRAMDELQDHAEMVIVIGFDDDWKDQDWSYNFEYTRASATILIREETAKRLALNIKSVIGVEPHES